MFRYYITYFLILINSFSKEFVLRVFVCINLLGFFAGNTKCQPLSFTLYNEKDGLPAGFVTSVFKDSRGIVWLGTTNGLCRFDGRNFINYGLQYEIPDLHVKYIDEHEDGTLVVGFHHSVCHFDGRVFKTILNGKGDSQGFYFYEKPKYHNEDTRLIINGIHYVWQQNKYKAKPVQDIGLFTAWVKFGTDTVFAHPDGRVNLGKKNRRFELLPAAPYKSIIQFLSKDSLLIVNKKGVYCLSEGRLSLVKRLNILTEYDVIGLAISQHQYVWVSIERYGTLCIDLKDKHVKHYHSGNSKLSNFDIPRNFGDAYVWFASSHGLVKFRESAYSIYTRYFDASISNVHGFFPMDSANYLLSTKRGIFKVSGSSKLLRKADLIQNTTEDNSIIELVKHNTKGSFLGVSSQFKLIDFSLYPPKFNPAIALNKAIPSNSERVNSFYAKSMQGILISQPGKVWLQANDQPLHAIPVSNSKSIYLRSFVETKSGMIWGIHLDGICKLVNKEFTPVEVIPPLPATAEFFNITQQADTLWVGTLTDGLYGLIESDSKLTRVVHIHEKNGLLGNSVYKTLTDKDGDIWMITNRGLQCLLKNKEGRTPVTIPIPGYHFEELLNANIRLDSVGQIWFHNPHSLVAIDLDRFKQDNGAIKVFITAVEQGDSLLTGVFSKKDFAFAPPLQVELAHHQNNLTISFSAMSYHSEGIFYKYKLKGAETEWNEDVSTERVVYTGLAPGFYTFTVSAATPGSAYGEETIFSFNIQQPFYKTFWFLGTCGLLFFGGILFWYQQKLKRINEQNAKKMLEGKKMAQLQVQSLQAQLNPHFIFNALNSIQDYILSHNATEASRFLSRFAKLMRLVLENSSRNILPIVEVADMMNRYLELESLRLDEEFEYRIYVDPQIDSSSLGVPLMMIQPFVENAIWHGLMPKPGKKELNMHIVLEAEKIKITIEDNGVGRKHTEQKSKSHKSKGAELAKESFKALSDLLNIEADIYIKDKVNMHGVPEGTAVLITLPKIIIQHAY